MAPVGAGEALTQLREASGAREVRLGQVGHRAQKMAGFPSGGAGDSRDRALKSLAWEAWALWEAWEGHQRTRHNHTSRLTRRIHVSSSNSSDSSGEGDRKARWVLELLKASMALPHPSAHCLRLRGKDKDSPLLAYLRLLAVRPVGDLDLPVDRCLSPLNSKSTARPSGLSKGQVSSAISWVRGADSRHPPSSRLQWARAGTTGFPPTAPQALPGADRGRGQDRGQVSILAVVLEGLPEDRPGDQDQQQALG